MKTPYRNVTGPMKVVSYEQALKEGIKGVQIRRTSLWHKEAAETMNGRAKERHLKLAADLNRLAAKLEETGHS